MASSPSSAARSVDQLLKALLLLSRTTEHLLESRTVESAAKVPLSASKVQILRLLAVRGGRTATQIARFLDVSKPAVTQIVSGMERDKLISRRQAEKDRREVQLKLTAQGRRVSQSIRRRQRELLRLAVARSVDHDAGRWINALESLTEALSRADRTFKHFCLQCEAHDDGHCVLNGDAVECPYLSQGHAEARSSPSAPRRRKVKRA